MTLRERPLLLPALALWGWQAELLPAALALGVLIELPRLVPVRHALGQADFARLWNLTAVAFLGVVLYLGLSSQGLDGMGALTGDAPPGGGERIRRVSDTAITVLRWLPFILYPFTLVHAWSRLGALPWSTFSLYEQARSARRRGPAPAWAAWPLHPGLLFTGVTLFASTASVANEGFYPLAALAVLLLALWPQRTRGHHPLTWLALVGALIGLALVVRQTHLATRDTLVELGQRLMSTAMGDAASRAGGSQSRSATAIGAVGALKQSRQIVLRIACDDDREPGLLREAAFDRYRNATWGASPHPWAALPATAAAQGRRMVVERASARGMAPLAVPGALVLVAMPAPAVIDATGLGAVRAHGTPPIAVYEAWSGGAGLDDPPGPDDLLPGRMPEDDRAALAAAVERLELARLPPAEAVLRLERWLGTAFTYSLEQGPRPPGQGALAWFLERTRSGHCEYYATVTVLMLRAAGIPARYAVGYSPGERQGEGWIARASDAHAWTLVWRDGAWHDLDTTPGAWRAQTAAARPWWQGLSDAWDGLWHRFALWRQSGSGWRLAVMAAALAVLAWIGWRQVRGGRWRQALAGLKRTAPVPIPGADSELTALLALLERRHGPRPAHVPPARWLEQAGASLPRAELAEALALHQRLRFDPRGLDARERARLRTLGAALAALARQPA